MENIKNLLNIVEIIKREYDKSSKLNIDFNVFRILRKEHDEVNLHSKFIVELLSNIPQYSKKYRQLFLKNLGFDEDYFDDDVKVMREFKNIDILLQDKDKTIVVENKIYAEDQNKQLERYYDLVKTNNNKVDIFYLTLDGKDPSKQSLGKKLVSENDNESEGTKQIVVNLSYKENISNWIEECIKESATAPTIRETLVQYLEVVNKLSGNSESKEFYNEVSKLIGKTPKDLKLANDIKNGLEIALNNLKFKFWEELENALKKIELFNKVKEEHSNSDKKYTLDKIERNEKYYGLSYFVKTLNEKEDLILKFEIDRMFYWGFKIKTNGVWNSSINDNRYEKLRKTIKEEISTYSEDLNYLTSKHWLLYIFLNPNLNYRFPDKEFFKLSDEEYRLEHINNLIKVVTEITSRIIKKLENFKL